MNILYIGSAGALSLIPFRRLQTSQHEISAVGVYNPISIDSKIIALENESLALAASQASIPVIDLSAQVSDVIDQCAEYAVDVILMSCYARRLADEITLLADYGCYNMHPSLLPRYRGPEPIFWQMKQGCDVGVSWHRVTHEFDAGDVVAQRTVSLDDGEDYASISSQLAESGAELMLALLSDISNAKRYAQPQDPAVADYFPYPEPEDFIIDLNGSARQIYNFMCATQAFSVPYILHSGKFKFYLDRALDFDTNLSLDSIEVQGSRLSIPCNEGVLIATYTDKIRL